MGDAPCGEASGVVVAVVMWRKMVGMLAMRVMAMQ